MKNIYMFLILTFIFLLLPYKAHAETQIHSYQITAGGEYKGTPLLPAQLIQKILTVGYHSGKVVVSSTPDGRGDISIPDDIVVSTTTPSTESFRASPGCPLQTRPPLDVSHLLWKARNIGYANMLIVITYGKCRTYINENGTLKDYANVGPLYLVHFDDYDASAPAPFLELPWNYKTKGLSFSDAALSMTSYFDHAYPLLSTNITEPEEERNGVVTYDNTHSAALSYSKHDGYDWGIVAGAALEEPVLAAAAGTARYINTCKDCGNAIYIDHGNGYQTRYYHLLSDGLITEDTSKNIEVISGQQIGKTGYTGNVIPQGNKGAHIHFMVVQDKNKDGNFDDNIPDGLVDPFGWISEETDPWPQYAFEYGGKSRTGNQSRYLWKNEIPKTQNTVKTNGGTFTTESTKIIIPKNMVNQDSVLSIVENAAQPPSTLSSIKNVRVNLYDAWGNALQTFQTIFDLVILYSKADISRFKPDTLAIYSSADGHGWQKENTAFNNTTGEAKISINHLTQFALMGEKLDTIKPQTSIDIDGTLYANHTYMSPVELTFDATDEPLKESLGVEYILYKVNDANWQEYIHPVVIDKQGEYTISFYAVDGDGNSEDIQTTTLTIDYLLLTPTQTPIPTPTYAPTILPSKPVTPTIQPRPTVNATPTTKPVKRKKKEPYYCAYLRSKKNSKLVSKILRSHTYQRLISICNERPLQLPKTH